MITTETSHAFDELTRAYRERDGAALQWKQRGGLVVGCLGNEVPEEFLMAAGMLPVRVCGDPALDPRGAEAYIERAFDPHVRSQFARIVVQGAYRYLDHLVLSSSSDALVRVFYYLRALRQCAPHLPIPDLYLFDLVHSRHSSSETFNHDRARAFLRVVESWSSKSISKQDLAHAVDVWNENRAGLRQMAALRAPGAPRVTGGEALQIIGASMFMPRDAHTDLLRPFLELARARTPLSGTRLFLTGSAQDHLGFYELVESCGAVVVAEDHDWGNRHFEGEMDPRADPIEAIVDRYYSRSHGTARASISARVSTLLDQVRAAKAQGVVAFIYQKDDAPSWDFPEQRMALQAIGIPVLRVDHQPYPMANAESLRVEIGRFIIECEKVTR